MSYDMYLAVDTGGPEPAYVGNDWNCTSNLALMWRAAGADLASFEGRTAGECAPILRTAVERLLAEPDRFRTMNPPSGWGTYEGLVTSLEELLADYGRHPRAVVEVWR